MPPQLGKHAFTLHWRPLQVEAVTIPDLAFPHWEVLLWQGAWNGITLSATMAFVRIVTGYTLPLNFILRGF